VGPEGGFSVREDAQLAEAGFVAVSLGSQIYRSENAGVIAAGLITAWLASSLYSDGDHF
jgi:RsmE family RNA methyltransferase